MAIVFKTPKTAINTTTRNIQNLSTDCPPCPEVKLTTADVEYTENGSFTVTPESGFDGLSQVDVTVNIDTQSIADEAYAEGEAAGIVTGKAQGVAEQKAKLTSLNVSENGTYAREDGYNSVNVNVQPTLQAKTATPTTSQQVITADSDNDGLSQVTVEGVTSAIDANITAGNIKKNVSILGVTGSYDPQPDLEIKSVTYTTNDTYTITPTAGKDGMSSVEVTVNVSGSSCPDWSSIDWTCQDVTTSGLADDVAYTASVKDNNTWANDVNLVFAPKTSSGSGSLFNNCSHLKYCSDFELTGSTVSYRNMFSSCYSLRSVGNISCPNVTSDRDADSMFYNDSQLKSTGTIDMSRCTRASNTFNNCTSLKTVNLQNTSNITSFFQCFSGCKELTSITISDVSGATNLSSMFLNAIPSQAVIDQISLWDTSNVTDFSNMFKDTSTTSSSGTKPSIFTTAPSFDMSSATNVSQMFATVANSNSYITTIPQYDWSNVRNVEYLFGQSRLVYGAKSVTTVGGFVGLGKAFLSTDPATYHTLSFADNFNTIISARLTYQSAMNIINNLAAPDDPDVNDATLIIGNIYDSLTAEDIAIATAKRWTVVKYS